MNRLLLLSLAWVCSCGLAATPQTVQIEQARAAYEGYRYHESLRLLDTAPPAAARTVAGWRCRGLALGRLGQWEEAIQAFEHAIELEPRNVDLLVDLAAAQGQQALDSGPFGKFTGARRARATLEKAIAIDPDHVDARSGLFSYYLQAPGIVGGGRDKALAQLAALEKLDAFSALLARAEIAWVDEDVAGALAGYRHAQEHTPSDFRAYYGFGPLAALSGEQLDAGLVSLRTALTLPAHPRTPGLPGVYLRMGDIQQKKGDLAAARAAYLESLRIDPEYRFAREELKKLDRL